MDVMNLSELIQKRYFFKYSKENNTKQTTGICNFQSKFGGTLEDLKWVKQKVAIIFNNNPKCDSRNIMIFHKRKNEVEF